MARIPGVRYIQSSASMPYMQDAGQAIGQATQNLGEAITGVADIGFKFVEKRRKAKDAKGMSAFFTNLDAQATEFENDLIKRQDYSNWTQDWQAKTDSWGSGIDALDISNDAKAEMKLKYNEWSSAKATRLSTTALLKDVETTKGTIATNLDYYARRGDAIGYDREIQNMRGSGLFRDDQILQAKQAGERIMFETNFKQMLNDSPAEALKFVKSEAFMSQPGATSDLKNWGIAQAESAYQRVQKEEIQGVFTDVEMGRIITEDQMKERLAKTSNIDPEMHDEILFNFRQSKPLDQETRFGLTDGLNGLHDSYRKGEITLEEYRTAHDGLGQVIYSLGTRAGAGELRQRLHNLDPTNWGSAKQPKDTRMQTVQKLGQLFETSGAFGSVSDEDIAKMSPFDVASKRTEIYNAREATEKAMESWLQSPEGKDADEEKISDKFKSIFLDKAAAKILRPGGAWAENATQNFDPDAAPSVGGVGQNLDYQGNRATTPQTEDYINSRKTEDPKGASSQIKIEPVGNNLTDMVKHFEAGGEKAGFHAKAYWDYGQWSIGYGTRAKEGEVIDQAEAEKRLASELSTHKARVLKANDQLKLNLKTHQIDALTSFDYNTGKLETLLAGGTRDEETIASMMLQYTKAKGTFLPGLLNRRKAESSLFRHGYKGEKKQSQADPPPVDDPNSAPDDGLIPVAPS